MDFPAKAISGLSFFGSTLVMPQTVSRFTLLITMFFFSSICRTYPRRLPDQGRSSTCIHAFNGQDLQALLDLLWKSPSTSSSFLLRHQYRLDAGAFRCQQLFLQSADGQHPAPQGDLLRSWPDLPAPVVPVMADSMAVAMVIPAEGPSLGTAPSGMWIWISCFLKKSSVNADSRPLMERI